MRMPRIMVETPGAPVVDLIQLVLAVWCTSPAPAASYAAAAFLCLTPRHHLQRAPRHHPLWITTRQCQPCRIGRQHRPCTPHEGQLLRKTPYVGVLYTLLIFECCVNATLRCTRPCFCQQHVLLDGGELVCLSYLRRLCSALRHPPVELWWSVMLASCADCAVSSFCGCCPGELWFALQR